MKKLRLRESGPLHSRSKAEPRSGLDPTPKFMLFHCPNFKG